MEEQLEAFKASLPTHLYCTNDFSDGLVIRSTESALTRKYIEFNAKNSIQYLAFDIDRPISHDEIINDLNLPCPTFFIQNPANRHAHVIYALEAAVHLNKRSSQHAIRYAAAIESAYTRALGADIGYAGLIIKNPKHEHWLTYSYRIEPYSLFELAEYVNLKKPAKRKRASTALGRNCQLFDDTRHWAYQNLKRFKAGDYSTWEAEVINKAKEYNCFNTPLSASEANQVAKSVAKWTWNNYTGEGAVKRGRDKLKGAHLDDLRDKQVLSALITNKARAGATEQRINVALMRIRALNKKVTIASVAKSAGIHRNTVAKYKHLF